MTKGEFQRRVIELLNKYRLHGRIREKILPLFSLAEHMSQEEMVNVYRVLEEAILTQKETERLTVRLKSIFDDFNNTIKDVSKRLYEINDRLGRFKKHRDQQGGSAKGAGTPGAGVPARRSLENAVHGHAMKYNKQSFPGEKPNFGLKLNKLFSSYITEYGPDHITMVISDSILYKNNLILRISIKSKDVLIGSSKSLKLYESKEKHNFLVTDKPEVIPFGNDKGFHFKYITYEDILHLTNGDFFKVFDPEILKDYRKHQIELPDELREVGYYTFE
jgi:hypothetical protein